MDNPAFGLCFDGTEPPAMLLEAAKLADRMGIGTLWMASHLFNREPIASAALMLAATPRVRVALMAMSPYVVHPIHATMAAATLAEHFPGRVTLCFGVGAPKDLSAAGITAAHPAPTMRDAIAIARQLLAGKIADHNGTYLRAQGRKLAGPAPEVPIILAASGPQMLGLAGAVADGVLISAGTSPPFMRWTLNQVARAEAAHGRQVARIGLVYAAVAETARLAHDRLRRPLAFILRGGHHAANLQMAGTDLDQSALADAFAAQDWPRVETLLHDDVVRRHAASGTAAEMQSMLAEYAGIGLDEIVLSGAVDRATLEPLLRAALGRGCAEGM